MKTTKKSNHTLQKEWNDSLRKSKELNLLRNYSILTLQKID